MNENVWTWPDTLGRFVRSLHWGPESLKISEDETQRKWPEIDRIVINLNVSVRNYSDE